MKDDRLRVQMDSLYAEAIGRAVFVFSRLEWDAIWICEKVTPGYSNQLGVKTAGKIANDLGRLHNKPARSRSLPSILYRV